MQFLLSGSGLLELCTRQPKPTHAWVRGEPAQNIKLSVIGIGMARAAVQGLAPLAQAGWKVALDHRVNEIQRESGRAIAIDERVIEQWVLIYSTTLEKTIPNSRKHEPIGHDSRLEIAVALAYGLTLADPWEPFHDQLRALGLGSLIHSIR